LGTLVLSLIIPFLQFEISNATPILFNLNPEMVSSINELSSDIMNPITIQEFKRESIFSMPLFCYGLITTLLIIRFSRNICRLLFLIKQNSETIDGLKVICMDTKVDATSFFNFLIVGKDEFNNIRTDDNLIKHELAHSKQFHSVDILFLELLKCFFWFNPFIWIYKKEIVENHEYLADSSALKSGVSIDSYSNKIIQSGNRNHPINLTSGFSFIQVKNRLIMLQKKDSSIGKRTVKLISVLLLTLGVLFTFSFDYKSSQPFVVVVDAGHGGNDPGVSTNINIEKDINLEISKKLKSLSNDREIKIILIRNTDENLSLNERVNFVNSQNADLLLSLHCNGFSKPEKKGVEVYYNAKGNFKTASHKFSEILMSDQLDNICEEGRIKTANFVMLRDLKSPGVLIELGFLTNADDNKRLTSPEHQNKIAETIYNSLIKIKNLK